MAKRLASETPDKFGGVVNKDALARYVDRIENLHNDRAALNEDIKEVYGEAKDAGFDTTILRQIVRERRMESDARHSRYALLDQYRRALGMLADTPLGQAAMERAESETTMRKPKPFAEQRLGRRAGRRKTVDEALDSARAHPGEPAGSA